MAEMASEITSLMIVYSTVYSGVYQRKHQSSASLAFVREFTGDRWPVNSPHKWPVTRKTFSFDDVIIWKIFRLVLPAQETSTIEMISVLTGKHANSDKPLSVALNNKMAYYRLCNWSLHLRIPLAFLTTRLPINYTAGNYSVNDAEHAKSSLTGNSTSKNAWLIFIFISICQFTHLPPLDSHCSVNDCDITQ